MADDLAGRGSCDARCHCLWTGPDTLADAIVGNYVGAKAGKSKSCEHARNRQGYSEAMTSPQLMVANNHGADADARRVLWIQTSLLGQR